MYSCKFIKIGKNKITLESKKVSKSIKNPGVKKLFAYFLGLKYLILFGGGGGLGR